MPLSLSSFVTVTNTVSISNVMFHYVWLHNASNKNNFKKNLFIGMSRNIEKIIYIQKISFSFLFVHLDHQVEVCLNPEGSF